MVEQSTRRVQVQVQLAQKVVLRTKGADPNTTQIEKYNKAITRREYRARTEVEPSQNNQMQSRMRARDVQ